MSTDVVLTHNGSFYDISWTAAGDINTAETLDTYILMCLFEERRASPDEVAPPQLRRGWLGNESTPGFEQGSKVWEFEQERLTGSMLAELRVVVRDCLQPLIDDGLADDVLVAQPSLSGGAVRVSITIIRGGSEIETLNYKLWDNTGRF